ncbi:MAG TPA: hypothetical protein PLH52_07230 [Paludibacteraceae bacterium]|nr:hypothetical protein [Paludibacteraceae bacterium]
MNKEKFEIVTDNLRKQHPDLMDEKAITERIMLNLHSPRTDNRQRIIYLIRTVTAVASILLMVLYVVQTAPWNENLVSENRNSEKVLQKEFYSRFSGLNSKTTVKLYREYLSENILKNNKLKALKNQ